MPFAQDDFPLCQDRQFLVYHIFYDILINRKQFHLSNCVYFETCGKMQLSSYSFTFAVKSRVNTITQLVEQKYNWFTS